MRGSVEKQTHYGAEVWVNTLTEGLRHAECLCLNCGLMEGCRAAHALFVVCKTYNVAFPVTRCPDWNAKGGAALPPTEDEVWKVQQEAIRADFEEER